MMKVAGSTPSCLVNTHGHHFFRRGGEKFFFMSAWVKNCYRRGDVFGCHSLGEEGGNFDIKENNCFLLNKNCFFCHLHTVSTTQFDWKKRHTQ